MLDAMTPEQMDEWIAYSLIEPFGDEWRQTATVVAELNNVHAGRESELKGPDDYLPEEARIEDRPQHGRLMRPEDYEQLSQARWGSK